MLARCARCARAHGCPPALAPRGGRKHPCGPGPGAARGPSRLPYACLLAKPPHHTAFLFAAACPRWTLCFSTCPTCTSTRWPPSPPPSTTTSTYVCAGLLHPSPLSASSSFPCQPCMRAPDRLPLLPTCAGGHQRAARKHRGGGHALRGRAAALPPMTRRRVTRLPASSACGVPACAWSRTRCVPDPAPTLVYFSCRRPPAVRPASSGHAARQCSACGRLGAHANARIL